MIHYHGAPLSGTADHAVRFFSGRHALASYAHPSQLTIIAPIVSSFVLDNGAFSTWKSGRQFDLHGCYEWYEKWIHHSACDWALIPDVIEGDETANDDLLKSWPFKRELGVPVFHYHESLERLERLVNEWGTVALGSSGQWPVPGKKAWWHRTRELMQVACDSKGRPKCKLHGLRMLDPRIFTRLPLHSADSTNAARNCSFDQRWQGHYRPSQLWLRACVIAEAVESQQSAAVCKLRKPEPTLF